MWMSIFNLCFNSLDNNSLQWFQLKLIYRIFPTKEYLKKINIVNTAECSYCQESETILHMFVACNRIVEFWKEIKEFIHQIIGFQIKFSVFDILFGYQNRDQNKIPLNLILLVTKKYILDTNSTNGILNLNVLKYRYYQTYTDEKYLAVLSGKQNDFNRVWDKWGTALEEMTSN